MQLVGTGTCTNTMANVCSGDAQILMPMDHLPLAAYLAHPQATFLPEFGGRVPELPSLSEVSSSAPSIIEPSTESSNISTSLSTVETARSTSTDLAFGDISQRCFHQLEL